MQPYPQVLNYIESHISDDWKKLTLSLTSNAAERWNRCIEKLVSGRYGIKSTEFLKQLLSGLWLNKVIHDKRHINNQLSNQLNIRRICQENLKLCNIIEFAKRNLLKKAA